MKIKVYERYNDGYDEYIDDYSKDKEHVDVISITESDGNYIIILDKENYFGKLVFALGVYEDVEVELISANEDEILRFAKDMERFRV